MNGQPHLKAHRLTFAVLESVGDDVQCQCLRLGSRSTAGLSIGKHARQLRHFCQPTPIRLLFAFQMEIHARRL